MSETLVDPRVSRQKFDREIAQYRQVQDDYIRRGWWMVKAEFPTIFVVFGSNKGIARIVVFGALIDFTNYDLWPPSVRIVDPFTMVPYKKRELPYPLWRQLQKPKVAAPTEPPVMGPTSHNSPTTKTSPTTPGGDLAPEGIVSAVPVQALAQGYDDDEVPFICLPGVREYHENPAHTGDSWLLHRGRGEGTLNFILEQLYKYGVQPLKLSIQVQAQVVLQPEEIPT